MTDEYFETIFNQIYPIESVFLTTKNELPFLFYRIGNWKFIGSLSSKDGELIGEGFIPSTNVIYCYKRIA